MFSNDVVDLLKRVLSSWEVIAVTIVLVLYLDLVFYVARLHNRQRKNFLSAKRRIAKLQKPKPAPAPSEEDDEGESE